MTKTLLLHAGIIVGIVAAAVMLYEGYDFLPQTWKDTLADKKVKIIAAVTFFAPDALAMASAIDPSMLEGIAPTATVNVLFKVVAALTFVARLQSFWDKKPEPE